MQLEKMMEQAHQNGLLLSLLSFFVVAWWSPFLFPCWVLQSCMTVELRDDGGWPLRSGSSFKAVNCGNKEKELYKLGAVVLV